MQACSSGEGQVPGRLRHLAAAARSSWRRLSATVFGRDLALVLALKVALVFALYVFLFRPALHPAQDPAATAAAVAGAMPAMSHEVRR
jgi:hypothetical protein